MLLRSPEVSAETLLLLHSCREDRRYPQLSVQVAFSHELAGCPRNCLCPVYGFVEILKNRGGCGAADSRISLRGRCSMW